MRRKTTLAERQAEAKERNGAVEFDWDQQLIRYGHAKMFAFILHVQDRSPRFIASQLKKMCSISVSVESVEGWIERGCPLLPPQRGSKPSIAAEVEKAAGAQLPTTHNVDATETETGGLQQ